jgi:hypothetical protein
MSTIDAPPEVVESILSDIDHGYSSFVKEWGAKKDDALGEFEDGRFHASSIGLCPRQNVLKRALFRHRPFTPDEEAVFAEANLIHDIMGKTMMEHGMALAHELRVVDERRGREQSDPSVFPGGPAGHTAKVDLVLHPPSCAKCHGETDLHEEFATLKGAALLGHVNKGALARFEGHLVLHTDIKSMHPNAMRYAQQLPKQHHVDQVNMGSRLLKASLGLNTQPAIYYRGRGGGQRAILKLVRYNRERIINVCEELEDHWSRYVADDVLPPILPLTVGIKTDQQYGQSIVLDENWECGYCKYASWHNEDGNFRCEPNTIHHNSGDRIAIYRDNCVYFVGKWTRKCCYSTEQLEALMPSISAAVVEETSQAPRYDTVFDPKGAML